MKIVAVSRSMNEDDIIEPFIRHHATMVDHHIILDGGSVDRTMDIVRKLKEEGLPLTILINESAVNFEEMLLRSLHYYAIEQCQADWIVFLDIDEFIDGRAIGWDVRGYLEKAYNDNILINLAIRNYVDHVGVNNDEIIPVKKFTHRFVREEFPLVCQHKIILKSLPVYRSLRLGLGAHQCFANEQQEISGLKQKDIFLAHYATRSRYQFIVKALLARIRLYAANDPRPWGGSHLAMAVEAMKRDPESFFKDDSLLNGGTLVPGSRETIYDPVEYQGGELRYTENMDYVWRGIRILTGMVERLALSHGKLLESDPGLYEKYISESSKIYKVL